MRTSETGSGNVSGSFLSFKGRTVLFFKKYSFTALFSFFFGAVLYSLMMSQQLTNTFDGLWMQNYHHAGNVELTSGRWMLIFVDKLIMGLHADPIASIAALVLFVAGFILVLDLFAVEKKLPGCLCLMLFISSTAVSCILSYRFTSFGYGLAYFLTVLSVYSVIRVRNSLAAVVLSGILLGVSMSCYQAFFAVFCVVAAFYFIFICSKPYEEGTNKERTVLYLFLRIVFSLLIGFVFYLVSLSFFLKFYDASLSGYNQIGEATFGEALAGLPQNIFRSYQYFAAYFLRDGLKINRLQPFGVFYALLGLFVLTLIVIAIKAWKTKKRRVLLLLFAAAVIPVACNAYMLLAGGKLELQMTAGIAMFMPLTIIVAFSCFGKRRCLQVLCAVFGIILLYGNAMQVWFDQEAMYEGQSACETMVTQVISDLQDENLLSADYDYYFVGVPAENPFFSVSNIYRCANAYARLGNFWVSGECGQLSYKGLINTRMGFNLPISSLNYDDIAEKANISEMPMFPEDGYLALADDHTVIIKISEYKDYAGHSKYEFPLRSDF